MTDGIDGPHDGIETIELPAYAAPIPRGATGGFVPVVAFAALVLVEVGLFVTIRASAGLPGVGSDFGFVDGLILFLTISASTGLLLRLRRPANVVGRLLSLGPLLIGLGFLGYAVAALRAALVAPDDEVGGLVAAIGGALVTPGVVVLFNVVALVFPDGRLPNRRWRAPALGASALVGVGSVLALLTTQEGFPPNPLALRFLPSGIAAAASVFGGLGLLGWTMLAVASVVTRFRRATGVARQQLRWFLAAIVLNAFLLPLSFLTEAGPAHLIDLLSVIAATLIPIAIGIAILRYRLYELDAILNLALVYSVVTAILAGLMAAAVTVTKEAFTGLVGQGSDLSVVISTIVVVSLFEPIKKRVQGLVDRRLRPTEDAAAAAARLLDETRQSVSPLDVRRTLRRLLVVSGMALRASGGHLDWEADGGSEVERWVSDAQRRTDSAPATEKLGPGLRIHGATDALSVSLSLDDVADPAAAPKLESILQAIVEELASDMRSRNARPS